MRIGLDEITADDASGWYEDDVPEDVLAYAYEHAHDSDDEPVDLYAGDFGEVDQLDYEHNWLPLP